MTSAICTGRSKRGPCQRTAVDGGTCRRHAVGYVAPKRGGLQGPRNEAERVANPDEDFARITREIAAREVHDGQAHAVEDFLGSEQRPSFATLDAAGRGAFHVNCVREHESCAVAATSPDETSPYTAAWRIKRIEGHALRAAVALLEYALDEQSEAREDARPQHADRAAPVQSDPDGDRGRAGGVLPGAGDAAPVDDESRIPGPPSGRLIAAKPLGRARSTKVPKWSQPRGIEGSTVLVDSDPLPAVVAEFVAAPIVLSGARGCARVEAPGPGCLDDACGGRWDCKHVSDTHVAITSPTPATLLLLPGMDAAPRGRRAPDERVRQKELGQYFTPPWLAAEVVKTARVDGLTVLEPSAGSGNIVAELLKAGAAKVIAIDIDPRMCAALRRRFVNENVEVICADFLSVPLASLDHIDAIVGNPPYDKGTDSDHLARIADLIERQERAPTRADFVEASLLVRTVVLHSKDRARRVWDRLSVRELVACEDRIAFEIDGVTGDAGKIDVSIMRLGWRLPGEADAIRFVREPAAMQAVGS